MANRTLLLAVLVTAVAAALVVRLRVSLPEQVRVHNISEIELAPNRRPYLNDDQMEGPRLDKALGWALGLMAVVAVGLPLYWLHEPSRQASSSAPRCSRPSCAGTRHRSRSRLPPRSPKHRRS